MPGMIVTEDADFTYEFDQETGELKKVPKSFSAANAPPANPGVSATPAPKATPAPAAIAAATPNGAPTPPAMPAGPAPQPGSPPSPLVPSTKDGLFTLPDGSVANDLVNRAPAPARAPRKVTPGFRAVLETESSGGKNKKHKQVKDPEHPYYLHTAAGMAGLMPQNVLHLIRDYPDLRAKHFPRVAAMLSRPYDDDDVLSQADADRLTAMVNDDEELDLELAERFWKEHADDTATKDPATGKVARYNDDRAYALWRGGPEGLQEYDKFMATGVQSKTRPKTISDVLRYKRNRSQFQDPNGYDVATRQVPQPAPQPTPVVGSVPPPAGPGAAQPASLLEDPAAMDPFQLEFRPLTVGPGGAPAVAGGRIAETKAPPPELSVKEQILAAGKKPVDPNDPMAIPFEEPVNEGTAVPVGTLDREAQIAEENRLGGRVDPTNLEGALGGTAASGAGASGAAAGEASVPADDLRSRIREARKVFERDFGGPAPEIDPQRIWKSKSRGMNILKAVAAALGAAGAALTGGPNTAWEIIQAEMMADLDAQKATGEDRARRAQQMLMHINSMIDELAIDAKAGSGGSRPPATMVKDAQLIETGFQALDALEAEYSELSGVDWAKSAGGWAPWATKASQYEAHRDQVLTDIIFNYSGKQTNPSEIERLTRALPSAYKLEGTEKGLQRLRAMRESLKRKASALERQAQQTYGKSLLELSPELKQKLPGSASFLNDVAADVGFSGDVSGYEHVEEQVEEGAE